jgi:hypothetical protein
MTALGDDNLFERNRAIVADAINQRWKAQPENTVGGWCVTVEAVPGTPADGNPPIVYFCSEDHARHVADLHNDWLARSSPRFTTIQELRDWLRREYPWTQFVAEDQFEDMVQKLYETRDTRS